MGILKLLSSSDPRLKKVSESMFKEPFETATDEVKDYLKKIYQPLITAMFETMYATGGIGLAAPQIGINKRLFVYDIPANHNFPVNTGPVVVIDPVITDLDDKPIVYGSNGELTNSVESSEGCLSVPFAYEKVRRLETVKISYLTQDFQRVQKTLTGLEAFCVQHETDHLDGILFVDRLSRLRKNMLAKAMKKGKGSSLDKMTADLNREDGALRLL